MFDDDYANWCARNTSYTGSGSQGLLASVPPRKVNIGWLAETLCITPRSGGRYASVLGLRADRPITDRESLGGQTARIIIAGFDRRRIPLVAEISSFDRKRRSASKTVQVLPNPPSAGALGGFRITGLR